MSCSSAICVVLSINSQVQVRIRSRADEERMLTHCSIIIDLRLSFCLCRDVCVQSSIFVVRVLHFSTFIFISILWSDIHVNVEMS